MTEHASAHDAASGPGRNRVSSQALTRLTQGAASEQFQVPPHLVRVSFADDAGALAVSLATPIASRGLTGAAAKPAEPLVREPLLQLCVTAKQAIAERVRRLSAAQISRVDIRLTSVRFPDREAPDGAEPVSPAAGQQRRRVI